MYNDPNQPQQGPYGQGQPYYGQPPYGQPQPPYGQPPTQYGQPQPPYGQPPTQYGQPPVFSPMAPPQPQKSRRKQWIILGIIAVVLLAIGGGIFVLVNFLTHNGATDAVNKYYTAIKNQDYATAYQYLDPNLKTNQGGLSVTQDLFIQAGQLVDEEKGQVTNYTITSTSLNSTNGVNTGSFTVHVTRTGTSYDVHLRLRQEGNDWKIISFDTI